MVAISYYFYDLLPNSVATKFDLSGKPIQYSSKEFVVLFVPLMFVALMTLINIMIKVSPQKFAMPNSRRTMDIVVFGSGLLLLGIHLGLLIQSRDHSLFAKFLSIGTATHRFAGKLMVSFGVLLVTLSLFYPSMIAAIVCLLVPALVPVYYSYRFYKTKEKVKESSAQL